ncbi:MobA-like NTP transferase domain-containing protein [Candidatus Magnetomoraceae bacterium gMMP-15]
MKNIAVIILAAGLGKRMRSKKAKVLNEISGRPMISYIVETALNITENCVVVIGHQAEDVKKAVLRYADVQFVRQEKQLGTGHAVICALPFIDDAIKDVVILCGDTPLLTSDTILHMINMHRSKSFHAVTVLGTKLDDPFGYGRIIFDNNGNLSDIIEEVDATQDQKKINIVNAGIYCIKRNFLAGAVKKLKDDNSQKEFYLTDIIKQARIQNFEAGLVLTDSPDELIGVNTPEQLAEAEVLMMECKKLLTFS